MVLFASIVTVSGLVVPVALPLDVTMNGNKNITATLARHALNVNIVGNGTVANQPLVRGTVVQLAVGWSFTAWSRARPGSTNPVSVTMDGVNMARHLHDQHLFAQRLDSRNGTVAKNPNQPLYDHGARGAAHAQVVHQLERSGDRKANPVNVTMDGVKSVTATFTINTYALTVTTVGGARCPRARCTTTARGAAHRRLRRPAGRSRTGAVVGSGTTNPLRAAWTLPSQ